MISKAKSSAAVLLANEHEVKQIEQRLDAMIAALQSNQAPNYPQLTDWVRAQPSETSLLVVFAGNEENVPALQRGDNDGKLLGFIDESELIEAFASGREYSAVWLSRYVDPSCESKIPRGVKVYRER